MRSFSLISVGSVQTIGGVVIRQLITFSAMPDYSGQLRPLLMVQLGSGGCIAFVALDGKCIHDRSQTHGGKRRRLPQVKYRQVKDAVIRAQAYHAMTDDCAGFAVELDL